MKSVTQSVRVTKTEITIQILTCSSLVGLLGAVGLRLSYPEVKMALIRCRLLAILVVNFLIVPVLTASAVSVFGLRPEVATGMILLAAAPFAPVVPVFARMARADLALAPALTGVFPLFSAILTPLAARGTLSILSQRSDLQFQMWTSLATLLATITLPLAAGVSIRH
jgi:BASS family bile acid:Na+ symporter